MMDPELNGARCDVCWPGKKNIASGTDNAGVQRLWQLANGPGEQSEKNTNVYRYRCESHRRTDRSSL